METMEYVKENALMDKLGNHTIQQHQKHLLQLKEKLKCLQMDLFQLALMFMKIL